jgi:alkylation response protein AidB-like acyl-CoA dehydrogenase
VPGARQRPLRCAGAFALSEPQAGSDPAAMRTVATKVDGGWRLSGTKQWITSGDRAGVLVVWAMTDLAAGHKGITAFLVRGGAPGLTVGRLEDKMGLHGSSTAQLVLDGVDGRATPRSWAGSAAASGWP